MDRYDSNVVFWDVRPQIFELQACVNEFVMEPFKHKKGVLVKL